MLDGNVIEVENITKKFRVYLDKGHTLKKYYLKDGVTTKTEKSSAVSVSR